MVNYGGTPGGRNDYEVDNMEEKMSVHGSGIRLLNSGDNGDCYAEFPGEKGQGVYHVSEDHPVNECRETVQLLSRQMGMLTQPTGRRNSRRFKHLTTIDPEQPDKPSFYPACCRQNSMGLTLP